MTNQTTRALENHDRFAYARDHGHLDFIQKAEQCDAYFVGEQWDEQLSNRADVSFRPAR